MIWVYLALAFVVGIVVGAGLMLLFFGWLGEGKFPWV